MRRTFLVPVAVGIMASWVSAPAQIPTTLDRIERLEILADLWGKLWLFHPNIVTTNVDWDGALQRSIAPAEAAQTPRQLAQALNSALLSELGDETVFAQISRGASPPPFRPFSSKIVGDSIGYLNASDPRDLFESDFLQRFADGLNQVDSADLLVIDLRFPDTVGESTEMDVLHLRPVEWLRFLLNAPVRTGSFVRRTHWGWRHGDTSPFQTYYQEWRTGGGEGNRTLSPIAAGGGMLHWFYSGVEYPSLQAVTKSTVLLVNNPSLSVLRSYLDALQSQPHVAIAWEKTGRVWESSRFPGSSILRYDGNVEVQFKTASLLSHDGALGIVPDWALNHRIQEEELPGIAREALRLKSIRPPREPFNPDMQFPPRYESSGAPLSREERLMALFKVWTVIRYFYPHLDLADINWETALRSWIPRAEAEQDNQTFYERTIGELLAGLNDSHIGRVPYPGRERQFHLPVALDRIRDLVYVSFVPEDLNIGIVKGDVVVAVDGVPAEKVEADWRRRISLSTESDIARIWRRGWATQGANETFITLTLDRNGTQRNIVLQRIGRSALDIPVGVARRDVDFEIGYINLPAAPCDNLTRLGWLDQTVERFKDKRGLILDLRGYPRCSGLREWLVHHFVDQPVKAPTEYPVATGHHDEASWFVRRSATWVPKPELLINKPVVVLINDRAMSSPENMALMLEQMPNVTLVGSHTVGASGDVTSINLPGNVWVQFTGRRVLRGDGSQFQNIGVLPDVEAYPTIEGIRAGRDEVLEKGIEVLNQKLEAVEILGR